MCRVRVGAVVMKRKIVVYCPQCIRPVRLPKSRDVPADACRCGVYPPVSVADTRVLDMSKVKTLAG